MVLLQLPNLLTVVRIFGSFAVLYFGMKEQWDIAFPLFCVLALTDMMDGTLARLMGQKSRLGAFLDPVADKILMTSSFLSLLKGGILPLSFTLLVFGRDALISFGVFFFKVKKIYVVYSPTYLSKFTTLFQILTLFTGFLVAREMIARADVLQGNWVTIVWGITALFTMVTTIQYLLIGWKIFTNEKTQAHC